MLHRPPNLSTATALEKPDGNPNPDPLRLPQAVHCGLRPIHDASERPDTAGGHGLPGWLGLSGNLEHTGFSVDTNRRVPLRE